MRFRVTLTPVEEQSGYRPLLRYDYQYDIAALLYNLLRSTESDYSQLHSEKGYKFFTFSRLEVPRRRATKDGLVILSDDCYLWFSSVDNDLTKTLANSLFSQKVMHFGGLDFSILGMSVPPLFEPQRDEALFTTMSPVLLRTTLEEGGSAQTWDLSPEDEGFSERLSDNLRRKYEFFHEEQPPSSVEVLDITNTAQKRIWIKNTSHRAHLMDLRMRADPKMLQFAYDCGLGEKTSMGFGMVETRR